MNADVSSWARLFEYRTRLRRSLAAGRKFADDRRGAVAVLVALAAVPLIGTIGIGVDSARGYIAQSRLSAAVDAAALAGGNSFFASTRDDDIKMIFHTNFPDGYLGGQRRRTKHRSRRYQSEDHGLGHRDHSRHPHAAVRR